MEEFQKDDGGKARWDLIPMHALEAVARVMTHGAQKYGEENWRRCPSLRRYWAAAMRHMAAWLRGEDSDPDTGESHLAHAACCILFTLELSIKAQETDDRADTPAPHLVNTWAETAAAVGGREAHQDNGGL